MPEASESPPVPVSSISPPPVPPPTWWGKLDPSLKSFAGVVLSAVQLRLGIVAAGLSLDQIDATIASIPDVTQRVTVQTYWQYATQFERSHPLIAGMVQLLGLTSDQADAIWRAAGGL